MNDDTDAALLRRMRELLDREEIRTVLYDYCRAVDRGDAALMKSCYHPDATDDHGFFVGSGWAFADYVLPILAQLERSIHSLTNPHIVIDGDRACVETQWSVIHRLRRVGRLTDMWHQGRYLDEFERRDGQWKIRRRVTVHDAERWIDTADLQRLVPDTHPQKVHQGRRGRSDPVYRLGRLDSLARAEFRLDELWKPLRQALLLPMWLVQFLGNLVQRRAGGAAPGGRA
ncbi:MAG: nuclear transport factor 2 family protein [Piscinibacter sp.]|uniref:nuclear transport factor 2 family protein n=1 Tax=Piscinibacter sp. TaxID=1903157 RepID=UPI002582ACE8|nr:nuclear transport factor 2 family protein [Piscinibacter sp.]MCW5662405.1 nuclear transport factor 2 family protein [Piscinibacter sp.]